jgi:hypothetical protein
MWPSNHEGTREKMNTTCRHKSFVCTVQDFFFFSSYPFLATTTITRVSLKQMSVATRMSAATQPARQLPKTLERLHNAGIVHHGELPLVFKAMLIILQI